MLRRNFEQTEKDSRSKSNNGNILINKFALMIESQQKDCLYLADQPQNFSTGAFGANITNFEGGGETCLKTLLFGLFFFKCCLRRRKFGENMVL